MDVQTKTGRNSIVSAATEVLILLLHLKHYPMDLFLAVIYMISKQTLRNIRIRMLDWFYDLLKSWLSWNTLQWRLQNGCTFFHTIYTFIIDGAEQFCTSSNSLTLDTLFYSTKKGHHSINILIIICPKTKKFLWISPAFPGSFNDDQIVQATRHLWYDLLDSQDYGLEDSEFEGLTQKGIKIHTTPTDCSDPLYKLMSSKRILVENRIADCKDWLALKHEIRLSPKKTEALLASHHKKWVVVAALLNDYK